VRLVLFDRVVSLAEEGFDAGVRIGVLPDSSLKARLVGHVRSVVCASPEYLHRAGQPRDPDALAEHACIAFTATTAIPDRWSFPGAPGASGASGASGAAKRERSIAIRPRLTVNTGQAAIDAALAGLGVVRVLSYQVDELVREGKLRILLRAFEPEPVPVHLVQLPGVTSRMAAAFVDLAAERLRVKLRPERE
jgi:DNA-binding transcriptional LysR family regulator